MASLLQHSIPVPRILPREVGGLLQHGLNQHDDDDDDDGLCELETLTLRYQSNIHLTIANAILS